MSARWIVRLVLLALALGVPACSVGDRPDSGAAMVSSGDGPAAEQVPPAIVAAAVRYRVEAVRADREIVSRVYEPESFGPIWVDRSGRPTDAAGEILSILLRAGEDGLSPEDYRAHALEIQAAALGRAAGVPPDEAADFDVAVTLRGLQYFHDLHQGRADPHALGFAHAVARDNPDYASLLRTAISDRRLGQAAAELRPRLASYDALREELARYRRLASDPALRPPQAAGRAIHPGDPYESARALTAYLAALGDLPAEASDGESAQAPVYDMALADAVRRFQQRHGLTPDGVIGDATQASLAVPLTARVRQIELALERLRWFPQTGAERLVLVNIPMFQLWAWDAGGPDGPPRFATSVIVGRAVRTETPVFTAEMRYLIFRPYWNVPLSIARQELLPAIRRDPRYLDAHQMEIVRGQSDDAPVVLATTENLTLVSEGLLRIRQRPGPGNSLGLVKFVFPNDNDVYLHGTPAMGLFAKSRRDFSHGCVRVADPFGLAEWVLAGTAGWTRNVIEAAAKNDVTERVDLAEPVQVVLFYSTAWVDPTDGWLRFGEDIYGRDARLDAALQR